MKIEQVTDQSFSRYGKIITTVDVSEVIKWGENMPIPEDVLYMPSIEEIEKTNAFEEFKNEIFGEMPIQMGYCTGKNTYLNALEYHKSSEINIAVTDMILILGVTQDIREDYTYDTQNAEIFFVPKGTVIELFATTLHYAPCNAAETGFCSIVILSKGTNTELEKSYNSGEAMLMTAKNKWLLAHPEGGLSETTFKGLIGENIQITLDSIAEF